MRIQRPHVLAALLIVGVLVASTGLLALGLKAAIPQAGSTAGKPIVVGTADMPGPKATWPSGSWKDPRKPIAVPNLVVVKRAPGASLAEVARAAGVPAASIRSLGDGLAEIRVPKGSTEQRVISALEHSKDVAYAERVLTRQLLYTPPTYADPNDSSWGAANLYMGKSWANRTWWLSSAGLNMSEAWPAGLNGATANPTGLRAAGSSKRVAVIDSGFYLTHPDKGNIVGVYDFMNSWDGTSLSTIKTDTDVTPVPIRNVDWFDPAEPAHGTAVAGEIAAATGNGTGTTGASWDGQVYVYKVMGYLSAHMYGDLDGDGVAEDAYGLPLMLDTQIAKAIRRAADDGCKIINLSLGGTGFSQTLDDAVQYARSKGALVVAATGNDNVEATGPSNAFYPAASTGVLGVGSFEPNDTTLLTQRSVWTGGGGSNYGYGLDLYAPGSYVWGLSNPTVDVDGSWPEFTTGYGWWTGTSMATPAAAAGLSWLWRAAPSLTAQQIIDYARANSKDVHVNGSSALEPVGGFDVAAAYAAIVADYPPLSAPTLTQPAVIPATTASPSWTAVPGSSVRYTVTLDGVVKSSGSSALSADLAGLTEGTHTLNVQATSAYNWYGPDSSVTQTFTVNAVPPAISTFAQGNGLLTWAHNENAVPHVVKLAIDGGPSTVVTDADYDVTALASGSHEATLTVIDAMGREASQPLDFVVDPALRSESVSLALSPSTITYGSAVKMTASGLTSGTASSLGGFTVLEISADGVNWRRFKTVDTTATSTVFTHAFSSNYYVRVVIPGAAPSAPRRVLVKAVLKTPSVSPTPRRWRTSTVSGRITPRHTPGTKPVELLIQRKVSGVWKTSIRTTVKVTDGYAWKYSWRPSSTGTYRIRAGHSDAGHTASYSAFRTVTVR